MCVYSELFVNRKKAMAERALDPNENLHEQVPRLDEQVGGATGGELLDDHHEQRTNPDENESPVVAAAAGDGTPGDLRKGPAMQPATVVPSADEEARPVISAARRVRTTEPISGIDLLITQSGLAAENPITVPTMMRNSVSKTPDRAALCYKEGGSWKSITYTEYYQMCVAAAKSFLKVTPSSKAMCSHHMSYGMVCYTYILS